MGKESLSASHSNTTIIVAGAAFSLLSFSLALIFLGGPFREMRIAIGIESYLAGGEGVYADCSQAENRNNKFCRREYQGILKKADGRSANYYRSPKEFIPFSLNDGAAR